MVWMGTKQIVVGRNTCFRKIVFRAASCHDVHETVGFDGFVVAVVGYGPVELAAEGEIEILNSDNAAKNVVGCDGPMNVAR